MKSSSLSRLFSLKRLAITLAGLLVVVLLFLWLALPRIIQSQAEKFVTEKTGHRLSLARSEFNPFNLSLRVAKLQLTTADGKPLLALDELLVNISVASLPRRTLVFDKIQLNGLDVTLIELPGGGFNWTPFLTVLKSGQDRPEPGLPRLDIHSFVLTGGRLDFADQRTASGFAARIGPLDLSLTDISTLPNDQGQFRLAVRTSLGALIQLQGELMLNPVAVTGTLNLADLQLAELAPYLGNILSEPPQGTVVLSARYRVGNDGNKLAATIEQIAATLSGLRLPLQGADGPVVMIDNIELKGGRVNLVERSATLGHVVLAGGHLQATRNAQGQIDLLEAAKEFFTTGSEPAKPPSVPVTPAWRYRLDKLDVANLNVVLRDASVQPAVDLALENITLNVTGMSDDLQAPLPVRLAFDVRAGGRFEGEGSVIPAEPTVDFKLKLTDLTLKPAQPYLAQKAHLAIADGRLSSQGRIGYNAAQGVHYRGDFTLADLRLNEAGGDNLILAWKSLDSRLLTLTSRQLKIGELRLDGLNTRLIIDKNKSSNFNKLIKPAADAAPPTAAAKAPPGAPPFRVDIDRIGFRNGAMDFADHSLVQPFGTRIHKLSGSVSNLSSRPGAPGQVELDGEVDDYGLARAAGEVDLFNPTESMDLRVIFRNVDMSRLTPYVATFAGRRVAAGKLSLDLRYKIKQRQLQGENQIVIHRMKLGERIESASAEDLPLDLAIAILQDSDGRIELALPVTGNLDDPQFDYGLIVRKAISNVLGKIVTAPFRAMAALFGGGETAEIISFEAGAAQLTPPEREKLVWLAGVLAQRPELALAVGGVHAEVDRVALQEVQLRRAVLVRAGQQVPERDDPGPLSTRQPEVQAALESLFAERVGSSELAALKEGFRRANPGQMEENIADKIMPRFSGLLREEKTLGKDEVAQLKGVDFLAVLFERLQATEIVTDNHLQALAQMRGKHVIEALRASGVVADRLKELLPEKGASADGEIPVRLVLEAVKN